MFPVRLDEDETVERGKGGRRNGGKVFRDGMAGVEWILGSHPCQRGEVGGGKEVNMGVDYRQHGGQLSLARVIIDTMGLSTVRKDVSTR